MDIKIFNKNGNLYLRLPNSLGRKEIAMGSKDTKSNRNYARELISEIQRDIAYKGAEHVLNNLDDYRPRKRNQKALENLKSLQLQEQDLNNLIIPYQRYIETDYPVDTNYKLNKLIPFGNKYLSERKLPDLKDVFTNEFAPDTFNAYLRICRKFLNWLKNEGYAFNDPLQGIKGLKVIRHNPRLKPFTDTEISLILEGLGRYRNYYEFLLLTGMRIGEVIGLKWDKIDFEKGVITVAESRSRLGTGYVQKETKTGQIRKIPINERMREILAEQRNNPGKNPEYVFYSLEGDLINQSNFLRLWTKLFKKLGIPYRYPKASRHTAISRWLEKGYSMAQIADIVGHEDISMIATNYGHAVNKMELPNL